ncbi:cupin domain-containing protein [Oceanicella sp. SM1341]|uniref:cupin domain-containing protein n=1 Tax=Oceanicella sp. SM1341 TaxID=1548889 RepID=UPI000E50A9BA|nr:cupin domain-containing protein [Oceanicella sp. SM1341]
MSETAPQIRIGGRLRHARRTRGLSMKQVAETVECSESFISKLERDKVQPSLSLLHRLVSALGINVSSLFDATEAEDDPVYVVRSGMRPHIHMNARPNSPGVQLEQLVPLGPMSLLQANIHVVAPQGGGHDTITHVGEEMGFVLEGVIDLKVADRVYRLEPGDSFLFHSELPHAYNNPGETTARILWVNTPPTF